MKKINLKIKRLYFLIHILQLTKQYIIFTGYTLKAHMTIGMYLILKKKYKKKKQCGSEI